MKDKKLPEVQEGKEQSDKRLLNIEIVLGIITIFSFLTILIMNLYAINVLKIYVVPIILIVVDVIMLIVGLLFCFYIEQKAGFYQCKKCGHKYVPTFNQSLCSMHFGRTKFMKCPKCEQASWNKKVIK